jgi:hypothetical protein
MLVHRRIGAKRSGRPIWVKLGCTVLENQAIREIALALCSESFGMSCGAYLAAT